MNVQINAVGCPQCFLLAQTIMETQIVKNGNVNAIAKPLRLLTEHASIAILTDFGCTNTETKVCVNLCEAIMCEV